MSEDEFTEKLQALIGKARQGERIELGALIGLIEAEIVGLEMALAEGERF